MDLGPVERLSRVSCRARSRAIGMAQKPNAEPKQKTDKEKSERFIEAARKLGVDETSKEFERLFEKVVPAKRRLRSFCPTTARSRHAGTHARRAAHHPK